MTAIVEQVTGRLVKIINAPDDVIELNTPDGCYATENPPDEGMYYTGTAWEYIPPQPSAAHTYDYTTQEWVDNMNLDEIKEAAWIIIKQQRDSLEFGGFEFEGGIYDSDQVSQGRIMGAAVAGVDQVWTLKDNTTVSLTASQLQQLYAALQAHIASIHERGRIARQLIYEAETKEQVEAVNL